MKTSILALCLALTACAFDDELDEASAEVALADTAVTCGGKTYYRPAEVCDGTQCTAAAPTRDAATGLPMRYFWGPCVGGKFYQRPPNIKDVFHTTAVPTWTIWTGAPGNTGPIYYRPRYEDAASLARVDEAPTVATSGATSVCGGISYNVANAPFEEQGHWYTSGVTTWCGAGNPANGGAKYPCAYYTGACVNGRYTPRVPKSTDYFVLHASENEMKWVLDGGTVQSQIFYRSMINPPYP